MHYLSFALLLFCSIASGEDQDRVLFKFESTEDAKPWRNVNDGVMGGRSVGRFSMTTEKTMKFYGNLSLANNGGFASVRASGNRLNLGKGDVIVARVRGDGREYKFNVYAQRNLGGYSYRQSFQTEKGKWIDVEFPVDRFVATWRGRTYANQKLDPVSIRGMGFLLGDKRPGPFALEVEWIKVRKKSSRK